MVKGKGDAEVSRFEYDIDVELAEAIKAARDLSWRLSRASYGFYERAQAYREQPSAVAVVGMLCYQAGVAEGTAAALSAQADGLASRTRALRKSTRGF